MDAIKKKMEKLANETNEAEMRFCLPSFFSLYFCHICFKKNKLLFYIGLLTSKTSRPPMNWRFFSTNNNEYLLLPSQSSLIIAYSEHQSPSNNQRLNFFPLQAEKYEDQLKNVQKKIQVNRKLYITIVLWRFTKDFLFSCKCHKDDLLYMLQKNSKPKRVLFSGNGVSVRCVHRGPLQPGVAALLN